MQSVFEWANKWGVQAPAVLDLLRLLDVPSTGIPEGKQGSEEAVQADLMILAARNGCALWRNNSGALKDDKGRLVRYGLGNTSSRINEVWKSSDLIGILPMQIEPHHVGQVIGRFWAVECKTPGWYLTPGDKRGQSQARFMQSVIALGGQAQFATGTGDVFK